MPARQHTNKALPPPEVVKIIRRKRLSGKNVLGWYAIPAIKPPSLPLGTKHFEVDGVMDAYLLIKPFLGNKLLTRSIRTWDNFNGCGNQCDICLADAAIPSRMFSFESLKRLFKNKLFRRMLQPDSIRSGSSGDFLNHPQAIKILNMILWETRDLDKAQIRRSHGKERFVIKLYTNYRPNKETEKRLDALIEVAQRHQGRVRLVISLPFNQNDIVNRKFSEYVLARPETFGKNHFVYSDGLLHVETLYKNINVQDVRHPRVLFSSGRILPKKNIDKKNKNIKYVEADREMNYRQRGLVKLYLNPDSLWLMVYTSMFESHTTRAFTPITLKNIKAFSSLPWHPDFPTPPNWPGEKGVELHWRNAEKQIERAEASGKRRRPVHIIHK